MEGWVSRRYVLVFFKIGGIGFDFGFCFFGKSIDLFSILYCLGYLGVVDRVVWVFL